ncbi:hypothetical protein MP228_010990 [Amoeboaphelidium protococcarum]|nr:hypothetical protein MP228_010990 [Amoeboaphelidium protococcarum]
MTDIVKHLTQYLDSLSKEGKDINTYFSSIQGSNSNLNDPQQSVDAKVLRSKLIQFAKNIRGMGKVLEQSMAQDDELSQLVELINKEAETLEAAIAKASSDDKLMRAASFIIFPPLMSLAAAVKFYFSSRPVQTTGASSGAVKSSSSGITLSRNNQLNIQQKQQKSGLSDNIQITDLDADAKESIVDDILEFVRVCQKLVTYLKSDALERTVILGHLTKIVLFIKKVMANEKLTSIIGDDLMANFIQVVKDIRSIEKSDEIDPQILANLSASLIPLASSVRQTVKKLSNQDDTLVNSNEALGSNEDLKRSNTAFKQGGMAHSYSAASLSQSIVDGESNMPLAYKHDMLMGDTILFGQQIEISESLQKSSYIRDGSPPSSLGQGPSPLSASMQPPVFGSPSDSTFQVNKRKQTAFRGFGPSKLDFEQKQVAQPAVSSPLARSNTDGEIQVAKLSIEEFQGAVLRKSGDLKKIYPVSIDIQPPGEVGRAKYAVVFEVFTTKSKQDEGSHTLRKSDVEIFWLLQEINRLNQKKVAPFTELSQGPPNVVEVNRFLHECVQMFEYINRNAAVLKSTAVIEFVSKGLYNVGDVRQFSPTPLQQASIAKISSYDGGLQNVLSRPASDIEATFFCPHNSTSNRFSVYQVDPKEVASLLPSSISPASNRNSFFNARNSKYYSSMRDLRDLKAMSSSNSDVSDGRQSAKRDSVASMYRNSSNDQLNSSRFSNGTENRRSRLFSSVKNMSKSSFNKQDSYQEGNTSSNNLLKSQETGSSSKAKLSLNHKDRAKEALRFIHCADTFVASGFTKQDESTYVLASGGKEQMIIKVEEGIPRIDAAMLDNLVSASITNDPPTDSQFIECFFLTYRHWMKSHELLMKVIERYKHSAKDKQARSEIEQMQVASYVQNWILLSWDDFDRDKNLQLILEKFIDIIRTSKKIALMSSQILAISDQKKQEFKALKAELAKREAPSTGIISNVGVTTFISLDPNAFAEQLTKVERLLFEKIRPIDYIENLWQKEKTITAIDAWVNHFNQVSYWIGTEICTTPIMKNRVMVIENIVKIMKVLKDLNNYNALMAFISGLNMAAVMRLKKTWANVNPKLMHTLHDIERIMDPKHNYLTYRDVEVKLLGNPFVPFLGLYLKDLTFTNDGNPKTLANGLINFSKNWQIFEIIKRIEALKQTPYVFAEDPVTYDFCSKLIALPDKRLYAYSLLCEPRPETNQSVDSSSSSGGNNGTAKGGSRVTSNDNSQAQPAPSLKQSSLLKPESQSKDGRLIDKWHHGGGKQK